MKREIEWASPTVPVIDASHDCPSCRAQSSEFYDLDGRCLTCGQRFVVRSRRGDKPPLSVDCPGACGTTQYGWRATVGTGQAEARAAAIAEVRARVEGAPLYVGADAGATMRLSEIDRMRDYRRRVLAILDDVEAGR